MMDFFISALQKAFEAFLVSFATKIAERLAAPKDSKAQKKPARRRSKHTG